MTWVFSFLVVEAATVVVALAAAAVATEAATVAAMALALALVAPGMVETTEIIMVDTMEITVVLTKLLTVNQSSAPRHSSDHPLARACTPVEEQLHSAQASHQRPASFRSFCHSQPCWQSGLPPPGSRTTYSRTHGRTQSQ